MKTAGRISASIEILEDFGQRRVPLKTAIADWARGNRYAGAKDRAWISGLCLDVLRRRNSLAQVMGAETPRALTLGALRFLWRYDAESIASDAAEEPHGAGALSAEERAALEVELASLPLADDYPDWLSPQVARVFGDDAKPAIAGFCERADVDLRVNTLKTTPEKAFAALKPVKGAPVSLLKTAARVAAPDPSEKAPAVTVIPAFNKGWVEVQDLGSQIAAAAAGDIRGAQVLDFCAGGGGKTLALAAMMENKGQLFAYDIDARRLKPLFHRAKRAGLRNLQIRSPAGDDGLSDLAGKMDVVFVDAPCTGAGTWRRHPDTKWRLTPQQLERRMSEQDKVLRDAAGFVKSGGRLVYVTCSFLMEENEDRLAAFLADNTDFTMEPTLSAIDSAGLLTEDGQEALQSCVTADGAMRLTPDKIRADGFFVACLKKA